jgi:hypothetical protein
VSRSQFRPSVRRTGRWNRETVERGSEEKAVWSCHRTADSDVQRIPKPHPREETDDVRPDQDVSGLDL